MATTLGFAVQVNLTETLIVSGRWLFEQFPIRLQTSS